MEEKIKSLFSIRASLVQQNLSFFIRASFVQQNLPYFNTSNLHFATSTADVFIKPEIHCMHTQRNCGFMASLNGYDVYDLINGRFVKVTEVEIL